MAVEVRCLEERVDYLINRRRYTHIHVSLSCLATASLASIRNKQLLVAIRETARNGL